MSDETHEDSELFDTTQNEVAEDATDTESESTDNAESEQEQEGLELDDKTPSKAEETKLKSIKKWQQDIKDGKKTLDDLKPAQVWMKDYLKTEDSEPEIDHKAIAKELAREAIKEEREDNQFADLFDTMKGMKLSKDQMKTVNEKFNMLKDKGLSKFESLTLASEIAKVDFTGLSEKKQRMAIPRPSTLTPKGEIDMDATPFGELAGQVDQAKIDEHLRELVKNG